MELIRLNREQIKTIYYERMVLDFPSNELKPLKMIFESLDEDFYDCFGLLEQDIIGYVYVKRQGKDYLIDYLAVFKEYRNKGIGGKMIGLLKDYLQDANSIIGEVENPEYAINNTDKEIQNRRLQFYLRNGFRDTNVNVLCFGVQYKLIEIKTIHNPKEIRNLYRMHYQSMLPKGMFEKNIFI